MQKIMSRVETKFWGEELILNYPVPGKELKLENSRALIKKGPIIKITTTTDLLSIQVQPSDEISIKMGYKPQAKISSFYILEAKQDSFLVLGLKTYDKDVIRKAIAEKTFEELLYKVQPKAGEFYNIPTGLVYGIGSGLKILEVQTPIEKGFRLYDWNRLREGKAVNLQVEESLASIKENLSFALASATTKQPSFKNKVGTQIFMKAPTFVFTKCIILDLDTFTSYIAEEENVPLTNYVIISMK